MIGAVGRQRLPAVIERLCVCCILRSASSPLRQPVLSEHSKLASCR